MSEETWEIVKNKRIEDIELQLALQCAPLIAGLKISNLLKIHRRDLGDIKRLMRKSVFSWKVLLRTDDKLVILVYQKERLEAYLRETKVECFFSSSGYSSVSLPYILEEFCLRYERYMVEKNNFPHELGLLLGYPIEDVCGFIQHNGGAALCTGYWKVYEDKDKKLRLFESFENAKESLIRLLSRGMRMVEIIDICGNSKRRALTRSECGLPLRII